MLAVAVEEVLAAVNQAVMLVRAAVALEEHTLHHMHKMEQQTLVAVAVAAVAVLQVMIMAHQAVQVE
jgi:hypothetical protein